MKTCPKCKQEKTFDEFHKSKTKKDGCGSHCKECRKLIHKEHYLNNKEKYKDKAKEYKDNIKQEIRELKRKPCTDCKNTFNTWQMDWDHLYDKQSDIGKLIERCNRKKIYEELKKCELVCANCHRQRTYIRGHSSIG